VLVRNFGIFGVALGTLIPSVVVSLGFVLPYAMRVMGVGVREALREIYLPAVAPVLPAVIVLNLLQRALEPSSIAFVALVAAAGALTYAAAYLTLGASEGERRVWRNVAISTWRLAGVGPRQT
jgi:hypothetical protein